LKCFICEIVLKEIVKADSIVRTFRICDDRHSKKLISSIMFFLVLFDFLRKQVCVSVPMKWCFHFFFYFRVELLHRPHFLFIETLQFSLSAVLIACCFTFIEIDEQHNSNLFDGDKEENGSESIV
jgi:hypothetical protein